MDQRDAVRRQPSTGSVRCGPVAPSTRRTAAGGSRRWSRSGSQARITKKTRYRLRPASVSTSTVNRSQAARPSQLVCGPGGRGAPKFSLTIDQREADVLDRVLAGCPSTAMADGAAARASTRARRRRLSRRCQSAMRSRAGPTTVTGRITCAAARRHGIALVRRDHPPIPTCATQTTTASSVSSRHRRPDRFTAIVKLRHTAVSDAQSRWADVADAYVAIFSSLLD